LIFSKEDRVDPEAYNRVLWHGLKGDQVYPEDSSLAEARKRHKQALKQAAAGARDADGD
jgi:hypothetical protein